MKISEFFNFYKERCIYCNTTNYCIYNYNHSYFMNEFEYFTNGYKFLIESNNNISIFYYKKNNYTLLYNDCIEDEFASFHDVIFYCFNILNRIKKNIIFA